jgi:hypothetical protein
MGRLIKGLASWHSEWTRSAQHARASSSATRSSATFAFVQKLLSLELSRYFLRNPLEVRLYQKGLSILGKLPYSGYLYEQQKFDSLFLIQLF